MKVHFTHKNLVDLAFVAFFIAKTTSLVIKSHHCWTYSDVCWIFTKALHFD